MTCVGLQEGQACRKRSGSISDADSLPVPKLLG